MKKRRTLIISLLLVAALAIGVGYAGLATRELIVSGNSTFNSSATHLNVNFVEAKYDLGTTDATATASAAATTASFNLSGLKKGETATFTYFIENQHGTDVGAKLSKTTENYTVVEGTGTGNEITGEERAKYVTISHKIYKAAYNTETTTYSVTSTEWTPNTDVLGYGEYLAVVVTVTLNIEPIDLIEVSNYTLKLDFDAVYDIAS